MKFSSCLTVKEESGYRRVFTYRITMKLLQTFQWVNNLYAKYSNFIVTQSVNLLGDLQNQFDARYTKLPGKHPEYSPALRSQQHIRRCQFPKPPVLPLSDPFQPLCFGDRHRRASKRDIWKWEGRKLQSTGWRVYRAVKSYKMTFQSQFMLFGKSLKPSKSLSLGRMKFSVFTWKMLHFNANFICRKRQMIYGTFCKHNLSFHCLKSHWEF